MNYTDRRKQFRAILEGPACVSPASVFDPLSARIAQSVGFELGLLSGSIVSATTLAAPDLVVHTITEFADQIRRISRASELSLLVDADHGYGNALNAMRTVQELEHAGASGISIEDVAAPLAFGAQPGQEGLVPTAEMVGKLKAALAAREDPALVIAARTQALQHEGLEKLIARVQAYATTGVDVIWLVTLETLDQLRTVHAAVKRPIIVGTQHANLEREQLGGCGARVMLQGHAPVAAAAKALRDTYTHLFNGRQDALNPMLASPADMDDLVRTGQHHEWVRDFMR